METDQLNVSLQSFCKKRWLIWLEKSVIALEDQVMTYSLKKKGIYKIDRVNFYFMK